MSSIIHAAHLPGDFENIDEDVESESEEDSKSSGAGVVDDKKMDGKDAKSGKKEKGKKGGNGNDSNNNNGKDENVNDSSDKYYDFNDDDASNRKNKKEKKQRDVGNITNERPNLDDDDTSMKHLNEDPMSAHDHTKIGKMSTSDAMAKSSASVFVRTAVSVSRETPQLPPSANSWKLVDRQLDCTCLSSSFCSCKL